MKPFLIRILGILLLAGSLCGTPAFAAAKGVVLNFNEVDISTMVKFISDLTGKNFVLDDRVKGKISIFSPSKLSIAEAYNVFTSVLELKGFTVVPSGKVLKIIPAASAKQSGVTLLPTGEQPPVNDSYIAQVIKLENISAQEALPFLQPLVSKDGGISAFGSSNLLVVDSAFNLRKIQEILETIDTERTREGIEVIFLKNAAAESTAKAIQQWLSGGEARPGQTAAGGGSLGSVLADQRLNALVVFGNQNIKQAIRELVAKLDVPPPESSSKVNVYYLENADATDLAKVLEGVVKGMTAAAAAPGAAAAQASPLESGKITITPDKATNSLVIMASPTDYANLAQVIKRLDRRSKQVFVQVVIAEVSLDKERDLGVQSGAIAAGTLGKYLQGGAMYDPLGTFNQILNSTTSSTATTGFTGTTGVTGTTGIGIASLFQNLSNTNKPVTAVAMLQALDTSGLVNVLSTPNILTSDNKEAEITVGENVPFQGSSTMSTFGTTQSVDRKDVGINLKIKPQISEGDYIRLEINQEISAIAPSKGQAIDLVTTKRAAKTSVVVKDGSTVVIGGLIQDQENESVSKVPFLGDIPGLGWLFKTTSKT
ncbi:MAG TPA: type II secretion system secretin GspD, partial [Desulfuromonadaceae bacterium]